MRAFAWNLDALSRQLRRSVRFDLRPCTRCSARVVPLHRDPTLTCTALCVMRFCALVAQPPLTTLFSAIAPSGLPLLSHRAAIFVAMNRSGASRASGSGAAAAAKLGDSKLLRTKHIDTLEVLETYSQDMARLQKENKSLAQQLSKFVRPLQRTTQRVLHVCWCDLHALVCCGYALTRC